MSLLLGHLRMPGRLIGGYWLHRLIPRFARCEQARRKPARGLSITAGACITDLRGWEPFHYCVGSERAEATKSSGPLR